MNFKDKLNQIVTRNDSLLCIGLDSQLEKIPFHLKKTKLPIFEFNREIIEATHDLVCAYKPNLGFYVGASGLGGLLQLKRTMEYLAQNYPEIPTILDAKLGDIAHTNEGYAKFIFDYLGADAVTLHPFLGKESLKPFLERTDKCLFILCRTSNEGAGEYQDLKINGKPLYQVIAGQVVHDWNSRDNCGLVVGATYPAELNIVRHIAGKNIPLLIPGLGVQGGDVQKTVSAGIDTSGSNAIINVSRGIIFASQGEDFAQKARAEAEKLRNAINKYRSKNG